MNFYKLIVKSSEHDKGIGPSAERVSEHTLLEQGSLLTNPDRL